MNPPPIIITGLPRSRTAWFANLLTWGGTYVHHDGYYPDLEKGLPRVINHLRTGQYSGHSDPANLFVWRRLRNEFDRIQWLVVKRDLSDVFESVRKIIPDLSTEVIGSMAKELDELIEEVDPMVVKFDDIDTTTAYLVADYFGVNIGPDARVRQLCDMNVQIHPQLLQKRLAALVCTTPPKQTL